MPSLDNSPQVTNVRGASSVATRVSFLSFSPEHHGLSSKREGKNIKRETIMSMRLVYRKDLGFPFVSYFDNLDFCRARAVGSDLRSTLVVVSLARGCDSSEQCLIWGLAKWRRRAHPHPTFFDFR